jgi:hypothetical protein
VNASSASNQTFALAGPGGELIASPGSAAADEVDLQTVLEHELSHVIGLPDNAEAGDLIDITLDLGERREPTGADAAAILSTRPTAPVIAAVGSSDQGVLPSGWTSTGDPQVGAMLSQPITQSTVDVALASLATTTDRNGNDQDRIAMSDSPGKFGRSVFFSPTETESQERDDSLGSGSPPRCSVLHCEATPYGNGMERKLAGTLRIARKVTKRIFGGVLRPASRQK